MNINTRMYKNFGKVYEIINDDMILRITLDVGPRIIYYGPLDCNIFYEDINRAHTKGGAFFNENYSKGSEWNLLGGHRLWKSPEDLASYSIDYKPHITKRDNGVKVSCDIEPTTNLIKELEIDIIEGSKVKVVHRLINTGNTSQNISAWALSVLKPCGKLFIPLNDNDKELLPTRNFVYWAYSEFDDYRFKIYDNYAILKQDTRINNAFKIGMMLDKGYVAYLNDDLLFVKTFDINYKGCYPDYGCNFETYVNGDFLECESLSELQLIGENECIEHTEVWEYMRVKDKSQKAVISLLKNKYEQKAT